MPSVRSSLPQLRVVQARRDKEASASVSAVEHARQERMRIIAEAEAKERAQADALAAEVCSLPLPGCVLKGNCSQHRIWTLQLFQVFLRRGIWRFV